MNDPERANAQNGVGHSDTDTGDLRIPAPIIDSAVLPVGVWIEGAGNGAGTWVSERLVMTVSTDPTTGQIISANLTADQESDQCGDTLYMRRPPSATR